MAWIIASGVYIILLMLVCLRIIFETHSNNKTLAYLLFCIFIPVFGICFYLAFGINYWHKKKYGKKSDSDAVFFKALKEDVTGFDENTIEDVALGQNAELATMLIKQLDSPLTCNNNVKILINGEEKFPELMQAIEEAQQHIHIEYYIFECDETGNALIELLIKKAKQGLEVRLIYDDFGSPTINKKTEKRMQEVGIKVYPFHKVHFYLLANRINYRNHRKIVVIDGHTGFVGGINVSNKYVNKPPVKLFWRDTHIRIDGPGVFYLQYLFLADWNFCCNENIVPDEIYFSQKKMTQNQYVQIVASGPDSMQPSVLFSILQAIYLAKAEILIATPYFIPGDSLMNALCVAALSGLKVQLLVPGKSDSRIVNAASKSNYNELLNAGVEIFLYQKGFIHAKTIVTDGSLAIVGTANMDYRSFDLNFEVNAIIYDTAVAEELRKIFLNDLKDAEQINKEHWLARSSFTQLPEKIARLFSPVL